MYTGSASSSTSGSGIPLLTAAAAELEQRDLPRTLLPGPAPHQSSSKWIAGDDSHRLDSTRDTSSGSANRIIRGACRRCKKMKMKCEYTDDSGPCVRCKANSHACSVEPKKLVSHKSARSELLRQSQRKDELIAALVQHINKSVAAGDAQTTSGSDNSSAGSSPQSVAMRPAIAPLKQIVATSTALTAADLARLEIFRSGIIRPEEVPALFNAYFTYMNSQLPLLDPGLHYPAAVLECCTFLFTTICAIASRFLPRPDAYQHAMACARKAAADALISDIKTVHMCQAYILLGEFSPPAATWEQDRASLFRGLAIRLALDLNLSSTAAAASERGRERERTWLICAWLDLHTGGTTLPRDGLLRTTRRWASVATEAGSPKTDVFLCASVELFGTAARFGELLVRETRDEEEGGVSVQGTLRVCEDALAGVVEEWAPALETPGQREVCGHWLSFQHQYCKLRMLFAILQRSKGDVQGLYLRTWHAALAAMTALGELSRTAQDGSPNIVSAAPEMLLGAAAFAARTVIQLLNPPAQFSHISISPESRHVAVDFVDRLIGALSGPQHNVAQPAMGGVTPAEAHARVLRALRGALAGPNTGLVVASA